MKHWLGSLVAAAFLIFAPAAQAANSTVPAMTAATSVVGTDLFYCVQSAGTLDRKCTPAQMAAYIYGLMSGDATASGTGALTLATVNSNVGSFGSATNCTAFTTNAKGLITAASQTTCTPAIASVTGLGTGVATALGIAPGTTGSFTTQDGAIVTGNCLKWGPGVQDAGAACGSGGGGTGANPTATAGPTAVNGSATTFMRSDGAPAVQLGTASQKGVLQVDGTSLGATSGVAAVIPGCGLSNSAAGVGSNINDNAVSGTTDTIANTQCGTVRRYTNSAAVTVTVPSPSGFAAGFVFTIKSDGANTAGITVTPGTTIDGSASNITLATGKSIDIYLNASSLWATLPGPASGGGGSTGANPTATAGPTANNGSATTFMRSDASPAVQVGSSTQQGIVEVDNTTIKASAGVITGQSTTFGGQTVAPGASATMQGNGAKVQASTGTTTTNDCAKFDANGNTVDAGSACGGGVPAGHGSYATGVFYGTWPGSAIPGVVGINNTLYFYPFYISQSVSITSLSLYVTTPGSGSSAMVGIYTDASGRPSNVAPTCVPSASSATTSGGNLTFTVSCTLTAGWYWMGVNVAATTTEAIFLSLGGSASTVQDFLGSYLIGAATAGAANGSSTGLVTRGLSVSNTLVSGSMPTLSSPTFSYINVQQSPVPHVVFGD